jgi:pimeloyl-ACP methyl ester carboxylesterase
MAGTLHSAPLGLPATLPLIDVNALAFVDQFDVVLCELPGHGGSGQVADALPESVAGEYMAQIDKAP